jgi:hypothetical protein
MKKLALLFALVSSCFVSAQHFAGAHIDAGLGHYLSLNEGTKEVNQFYKPIFTGGIGFQYGYDLSLSWQIMSGVNLHIKGEKYVVDYESLTFPDFIDDFYGFVIPIDEKPTGNISAQHHYYSIQIPLTVRYLFNSSKPNHWFVGLGCAVNYVAAYCVNSEGYKNHTKRIQDNGQQFIPGVLLETGFQQNLGNGGRISYGVKYDQNLAGFYPATSVYQDWYYNVGVSIAYLWSVN